MDRIRGILASAGRPSPTGSHGGPRDGWQCRGRGSTGAGQGWPALRSRFAWTVLRIGAPALASACGAGHVAGIETRLDALPDDAAGLCEMIVARRHGIAGTAAADWAREALKLAPGGVERRCRR